MKDKRRQKEKEKILEGLKLVAKRLLEFKKAKNSPLVIMKDGKIVKIKVE